MSSLRPDWLIYRACESVVVEKRLELLRGLIPVVRVRFGGAEYELRARYGKLYVSDGGGSSRPLCLVKGCEGIPYGDECCCQGCEGSAINLICSADVRKSIQLHAHQAHVKGMRKAREIVVSQTSAALGRHYSNVIASVSVPFVSVPAAVPAAVPVPVPVPVPASVPISVPVSTRTGKRSKLSSRKRAAAIPLPNLSDDGSDFKVPLKVKTATTVVTTTPKEEGNGKQEKKRPCTPDSPPEIVFEQVNKKLGLQRRRRTGTRPSDTDSY